MAFQEEVEDHLEEEVLLEAEEVQEASKNERRKANEKERKQQRNNINSTSNNHNNVGDINRDGEEYSEYIFFRIAKVNNGIVLCSNGGGIYISDLDIINSFVYLDNGKYVWKDNDPEEEWAKTISYKIVNGYKFGIWTDPDGSNTYFTDGSFVVNPFGDFYTIDEKGQLIDEDGDILIYKGN